MLVDYADKYKNSLIGNFIQFLHNNPQKEKEIIAIAFCYDLLYLLYFLGNEFSLYNICPLFLVYIIFFAGGELFFYIMLYRELKIKDGKIKTFF